MYIYRNIVMHSPNHRRHGNANILSLFYETRNYTTPILMYSQYELIN